MSAIATHHVLPLVRSVLPLVCFSILFPLLSAPPFSLAATAKAPHKPSPSGPPGAVEAARQYAEALAGGDRIAAGRLDFACQYRLVSGNTKNPSAFPPPSDPLYRDCWKDLDAAHRAVVEQRNLGLDLLWPGKGALVFLGDPLDRYTPSVFVMDLLGVSPPGGGLTVNPVGTATMPAGSFVIRKNGPVVAAPATLVRVEVTYKDPLTSPATYAPDAYRWTSTVKRPRAALRSVTVEWVVLTGLKKLGFPSDAAVVNLPTTGRGGSPVPFLTKTGGYVAESATWWKADDRPGLLIAAVGRATQFPDLDNRIALLNRVLIIDPNHPEALTALSRDLYLAFLDAGAEVHQVPLPDVRLASRVNELYWNDYSQTSRMDLSLGMEMGGFSKPTAADYLYRMIPAMTKLVTLNPKDLENRLRLGIAYRWVNDQHLSIETHEAVVADLGKERSQLRARALIELAWSRIAKVAWNRTFNDPNITQALAEVEEAFQLAEQPLDKFTGAYTTAYALLFTPTRDNNAILAKLTEAQRWYLQVPGATPKSWTFLITNNTFKGLVQSDPAFQPLLAAQKQD